MVAARLGLGGVDSEGAHEKHCHLPHGRFSLQVGTACPAIHAKPCTLDHTCEQVVLGSNSPVCGVSKMPVMVRLQMLVMLLGFIKN